MELTLQEIKELLTGNTVKEIPVLTGKSYFFRTVTYHTTGKVLRVEKGFVVVNNAAWIADSGRWADSVVKNEYEEVEIYPDNKEVYINIDSIVDYHEVDKLPRETK